MTTIELKNIENYACKGINLKVFAGESMVLMGPNGAGKTTLLNVIAGLTVYNGSVLFDGNPIDCLSPQQRGVGYLFQDLVLFPHLDVASNICYGLKAQGWTREKAKKRLEELLCLLKIEHMPAIYPCHLSGGERQKVALARALAPNPRILLLDEPLSSLDWQTSLFLRAELRALQQKLGLTTLYVTHDLTEARQMADRMAIMHNGTISQIITPNDLVRFP